MSRLHPFDFLLAEVAESHFPQIAADGEKQGRDLHDFDQFTASALVLELVREIEAPAVGDGVPPQAVEYLHTLYVGFRYWIGGRHTVTAGRDHLVRGFTTPPPEKPKIPKSAVYVQLPEQWFWAQVAADAPHEPLDGLFVVEGNEGIWTVLAVLGLRSDRDGFSQVTVVVTPAELMAAPGMTRTPAFAPTLEGGRAAGLLSLTTAAELVHLALLAVACSDD